MTIKMPGQPVTEGEDAAQANTQPQSSNPAPVAPMPESSVAEVVKRLSAAADDIAPPPMRVQILQEGAALTSGDRDKSYGPPAVNLAASAELKAVFRKHLNRHIAPAELEAVDMVLTKLGRIATGPRPVRDNYVDAATYMAIAGEIALVSA